MIVVKYEPYKNDITTVAYPVPKVKYKFQGESHSRAELQIQPKTLSG